MKFQTPSPKVGVIVAPTITIKSAKPNAPKLFDDESELPDSVGGCDEVIEYLLEVNDRENYQRVAKHANDLVGWNRWVVDAPTIAPAKKHAFIINKTETVLRLFAEGMKIRQILLTTGISRPTIYKILENANITIATAS